jgi:hypothetical protein
MGSFRATLEFEGTDYDVHYASFDFSREVTKKGLVASNVLGGKVTVRIASTDNTAFAERMLNSQFKLSEAKIIFKKTHEDSSLKTLEIKDFYIVSYREQLDIVSEEPMTILMTFSARELTMGNVHLDNRWDVSS